MTPTESRDTTATKWLGIAVQADENGLVVSDVLPATAALAAGFKRADMIRQIGNRRLANLNELRAALSKLVPKKKVTVSVLRGNRKFTLTILVAPLVFPNADVKGPNVDDKDCDSNCDCTAKLRDARCQTVWQNRGGGPHGGIYFRKRCTSFDANTFKILSDKKC